FPGGNLTGHRKERRRLLRSSRSPDDALLSRPGRRRAGYVQLLASGLGSSSAALAPSDRPFLNSLDDSPSERASFGSFAAPKMSMKITRMMRSSGAPSPPTGCPFDQQRSVTPGPGSPLMPFTQVTALAIWSGIAVAICY